MTVLLFYSLLSRALYY